VREVKPAIGSPRRFLGYDATQPAPERRMRCVLAADAAAAIAPRGSWPKKPREKPVEQELELLPLCVNLQ
jgi:hypothetical protein